MCRKSNGGQLTLTGEQLNLEMNNQRGLMRTVGIFATSAILAIAVGTASAQPIISAKSGVIANVEGKVLIDNAEVQQSVTHFPEVKEGATLRTEDGRVELMLPPGFMLRMGENGSVKMLSNRLIDTRVEIQAGSAVVEVDQTKPDYNVAIALKDGVVNLSKVGVYRFDADPPRLKVFHGTATVEVAGQNVMVASGKMLALTGGATTIEKFDVEQTDALDNWSRRRAEAMAVANVSGAKYSSDNAYPAQTGNTWVYNPYYDMYTYLPMAGAMCNPYYGLCFYSPMSAYRTFFLAPMMYGVVPSVGGYHGIATGSSSSTPLSSLSHPSSSTVSSSGAGAPSASPSRGGSTGGGSFGGGSVGGGSMGGGSMGSAGGAGGHGGGTGGHGK
jgi:hypothetical protein